MMPMIQDQKTIRYISERRCASGGYCFYRLDEPNAADTLYALASLALLDAYPMIPLRFRISTRSNARMAVSLM